MLFGHGDDFYNSKNEVKINFSSNVWHGANLEKLKEHLIEHFDSLTHYPEPDAGSLKRLLARRYEINEENVLVTNGSTTAFYMIAQTWKDATSMIVIPSFSEYEDACTLHGHTVSFFPTVKTCLNYLLKDRIFAGFVIRIIRMANYFTGVNY